MERRQNKTKRLPLILCLLAAVTLLIGGFFVWTGRSGGGEAAPGQSGGYLQLNDAFTDRLILDGAGAIDAVGDVADQLGVADAASEYAVSHETESGGFRYYRLAQSHEGVPVYGHDLVVVADREGRALALSGNYAPAQGVSTAPQNKDGVEAAASEYMRDAFDLKEAAVREREFVLYPAEDGAVQPAWVVECVGVSQSGIIAKRLFLADADLSVLDVHESVQFASSPQTDTFPGQNGGQQTVTYVAEAGALYLKDPDRRITVYEAETKPVQGQGTVHGVEVDMVDLYVGEHEYFWEVGGNPDPRAVDAMANAQRVYDFYAERFDHYGCDGNGENSLYVIFGESVFQDSAGNWDEIYNNAYHTYYDGYNIISLGEGLNGMHSQGAYLDVVAHEYTHGVLRHTSGLSGSAYSQQIALGEAYADILAQCVEDALDNYSTDWAMEVYSRNLADPSGKYLRHMNQYVGGQTKAHDASTIISHAAYLMYSGGYDGEWEALDSTELIAELWYHSLQTLPMWANFSQCRNTVELAAARLQAQGVLTEGQVRTVSLAFEQVGVGNAEVTNAAVLPRSFRMRVLDARGGEVLEYRLRAEQLDRTVVLDVDVRDAAFAVELEPGKYVLWVTEPSGDSVAVGVWVLDRTRDGALLRVDTPFMPSGGEAGGAAEPVETMRGEDLYADVLERYYRAEQSGYAEYDEAISSELQAPWAGQNGVLYALKDMDGNGIPELFIGAGEGDTKVIYDVYAYNGAPVRLFDDYSFGYRNVCSLSPDGVFVLRGSSGAYTGGTTYYRMNAEGDAVEVIESVSWDGPPMQFFRGEVFDEEISEAEFEAIRDSYPEINDLVWIRLASNPAFGESGGEAAQPQDAGAPADDALLGEWYNYLGPGHSDSPPLLILHDDGTFEFMEEGYALRRRRGALISGTYQVVDGVVECTALEESGEDTPRSYMSNLRFTIKEDGTLEYRGALAGRTTVQVVFERERPDE